MNELMMAIQSSVAHAFCAAGIWRPNTISVDAHQTLKISDMKSCSLLHTPDLSQDFELRVICWRRKSRLHRSKRDQADS